MGNLLRNLFVFGTVFILVAVTFGAVPMNVSADCWTGDPYWIYEGGTSTPPVADAGPDQTVNEGDTVLLDGTGSTGGLASSGGLNPDLAGLWHLDETSGTTAYDSTDNDNDGTVMNGGAWTTDGKIVGAMHFDGTNDYIDVGDIGVTGDWTVEFWANLDSSSGTIYYPVSLGKISSAPWASGIFMAYGAYGDKWGMYDGSTFILGSPVSTNTWYHIAVTKIGNTYTLYKNGEYENAGTLLDVDISNLYIGKRVDNYWEFDGRVDEVAVWSTALTGSDIKDHYHAGEPDQVALWWTLTLSLIPSKS
jgi:hypothetical protein